MSCPRCGTPLANEARFCPACGAALAATSSATDLPVAPRDLVGRELAGKYRILAKLGEGGMGAVYRGEQISLKRPVAVKVLRPELSQNAMLVRRFEAEAQVIARISHPNTINIYDFGQDGDGALFIAMELIEGRSLRRVVSREAPLPPARALYIAQQIAASLADAHAHAIVHRDLKPDNVMLQERGRNRDVVRVLDFGIAKLRDEGRQTQQAMTQAGDMLGTPQYMAPEQIRGLAIDGRVDIYALGCMIYEMVTGRMPFEAPNVMAMLSKHLVEAPVPPSARRPDLALPAAIDHLVLAAMQKEPAARPSTMEHYGEQIAAALASLPADPARPAVAPAPYAPAGLASPGSAVSVVAPSVFGEPGNAPSPAAGFVSPPPPAGFASPPPPASYGVQVSPAAGAAPVASAQGTPAPLGGMAYAPARARSRVWLYVLIAAVGLGAVGVAAWQLTRSGGGGGAAPADAAAPDPWARNAATPDPWAGPAAPANAAAAASASAPVDAAAVAPAPVDAAASAPVYAVPLPAGVHLRTPRGFARDDQNNAEVVVDRPHRVFVSADAIGPGDASAASIGAAFAAKLGVHYDGSETVSSKGQDRELLRFSGSMTGYGPIRLTSVVFRVSGAVVLVSIGVRPQAAAAPTFRGYALRLVERNLELPQ